MASAKKLPSGSWRCRVFAGYETVNGRKVSRYESFTADTKKKAEYLAAQFAIDRKQEKSVKLSFGEAAKKYIDSREAVLSPSTIAAYCSILRNHLDEIKSISVDRLTDRDLQNAINVAARNDLSPKTLRNISGLITAVLKAYRPEYSPYMELPKKKRPDLYIPTEEDIKAIMDEIAGTKMELPVMLAAFGPMRRGEICALRSENISGNVVHVCEAMVETKISADPLRIKSPKSYAGDRFIVFPDFVAEKFTSINGRVTDLTPAAISHRFARILEKLDLPHFRFHDLRHYSASMQHALGIPDQYIMQRGGWATDSTLKSVYRHSMSEIQQEMNDKANDYFSRFKI